MKSSLLRYGWILIGVLALVSASDLRAAYSITTLGSAVTENFSGWSTSTAPTNWTVLTGNNAAATFQSNAISNGGGFRRASFSGNNVLGFLGNSSVQNYTATSTFSNDTGSTITGLVISYTGVQFLGQVSANSFITVSYSINGGSFIALDDLRFNALTVAANTTAQGANLSTTLSGLTVNTGDTVNIKWTYVGAGTGSGVSNPGSGSRQGLGLTNVSVTANGSAPASELYWFGSVLGTDGTWSQTGGTAWSGTSYLVSGASVGDRAWDSTSTAVFQGPIPGTVTVDGLVSANAGVRFEVDGYTLTSGTLNLNGATTVNDGATATINSVITGTSGLNKAGNGTLVLNGANTFTGTVGINAGTLQISSDSALGDVANDVKINGTLKTTADISMGSGRDVSGGGTLDIADATTLTVNGNFNMGSVVLANSGSLYLGGATRSVGALTFNAAATIDGSGAITATGITASSLSGTAKILPNLSMGTTTINVGATGDVVLAGNLVGTGTISKTGAGTLELLGTNTVGSQVRFGVTGQNSGLLKIGTNTSLGGFQTFFNSGTLQALTDMTGGNSIATGLSVGASSTAPAVFTGANMTFTGSSGLFESAAAGQNQFNVFNTTTFTSTFAFTGSGGTGLTIGGTGTAAFSGPVTLGHATTVTNTATLLINGSWSGSSAITVSSGATLAGTGTIATAVTINGHEGIGDVVGKQTLQSTLAFGAGSDLAWKLVTNDNTSAGTNFDQFVVGGALTIDSTAKLNLVFNSSTSNVLWGNNFWDSDHTWTIIDGVTDPTGLFVLSDSSTWFDKNGVLLSTLHPTATFTLSGTGGDVTLLYTASVPEPSTVAMLVGGLGLVGWSMRRRLQKAAK